MTSSGGEAGSIRLGEDDAAGAGLAGEEAGAGFHELVAVGDAAHGDAVGFLEVVLLGGGAGPVAKGEAAVDLALGGAKAKGASKPAQR